MQTFVIVYNDGYIDIGPFGRARMQGTWKTKAESAEEARRLFREAGFKQAVAQINAMWRWHVTVIPGSGRKIDRRRRERIIVDSADDEATAIMFAHARSFGKRYFRKENVVSVKRIGPA